MTLRLPRDAATLVLFAKEFLAAEAKDIDAVTANDAARAQIRSACRHVAGLAYPDSGTMTVEMENARGALHQVLAAIYEREFSLVPLAQTQSDAQPVLRDMVSILEDAMLANELKAIAETQVTGYPTDGVGYVRWLKRLISRHPAAWHPFYQQHMRRRATVADVKFWLAQETNLDPRFDDILALLQIGASGTAKMEISRNYDDEMGNGKPEEVHTTLFQKALDALSVSAEYIAQTVLPEARVSGNVSAAMAVSRRHHYRAIGYFGVTEYFAPARFKHVLKAWERLGLPDDGAVYHRLHVTIDTVHGNAWLNNVIAPAIEQDPALGREIAIGALIRLNSSGRYLDQMLAFLQSRPQADGQPAAQRPVAPASKPPEPQREPG